MICKPRHAANNYLIPIGIFSLFACAVIWKFFFIEGCYAFDANDERNHTFVNLHVARDILQYFELPLINYFNNFGTPLLGDGLTLPFAIQSLTYYFLPDYMAMTVNRALICFFSLAMIFAFLRTHFNALIAVLISLFIYTQPAFFWHSAHHHYQTALFFFAALIFIMHLYDLGKISLPVFIGTFYVTALIALYSLSLNIILIYFPNLIVLSAILQKRSNNRFFLITLLILLSAVLAASPQMVTFLKAFAHSNRIADVYASSFHITVRDVFLISVGHVQRWTHYLGWSYFSLPLLFMGASGCYFLLKNPESRRWGLAVLVLGWMQWAFVFLLLSDQNIWWSIPVLKNTDIQRFHWASTFFIGLSAGYWLKLFFGSRGELKRNAVVMILLCIGVVLYLVNIGDWRGLVFIHRANIILFLIMLITFFIDNNKLWLKIVFVGFISFIISMPSPLTALHFIRIGDWPGFILANKENIILFLSALVVVIIGRNQLWLKSMMVCMVFATAISPTLNAILQWDEPMACGTNHFYNIKENAAFSPMQFKDNIEPFRRIASPYASVDLSAAHIDVLGSNGRSMVLDKKFTSYLKDKDLIDVYQKSPTAYNFKKPWQPEALEKLGVSYVINDAPAPELVSAGWEHIDTSGSDYLYRNHKNVTPFYLGKSSGERVFLNEFRFHGNSVSIRLPAPKHSDILTAAFVGNEDWVVQVNGEIRPLVSQDDGLLHIPVDENSREVMVSYAPLKWQTFFLAFLLSSLAIFSLMYSCRRRH